MSLKTDQGRITLNTELHDTMEGQINAAKQAVEQAVLRSRQLHERLQNGEDVPEAVIQKADKQVAAFEQRLRPVRLLLTDRPTVPRCRRTPVRRESQVK